MTKLFQPDNPVLQFIGKIGYSIYLNLLWVLCCIPIVTIGASTTALFYASQKLAKDQCTHLTAAFFKSFRQNFRQATISWLILLCGGIILGTDGYVLRHLFAESPFWALLSAVFLIAAGAFLILCLYLFPLLAHFDNTLFAMFKNSMMIGMRFLLATAVMAAIYAGMAFLIINVYTPLIFLGMGTCALLSSYLLAPIFKQCEGQAMDENAADTSAEMELS